MQYRSDWPEIGLPCAISDLGESEAATPNGTPPDWADEWRERELAFRWVAFQDVFESELYHFPIWKLHLEVESPDSRRLDDPRLETAIRAGIQRLENAPFCDQAYLFTRVVKAEPLYRPLLEGGFTEVERRRLYRSRIRDLVTEKSLHLDKALHFKSLAEVPRERYDSSRIQIFEICAESFGSQGFSRHFTDAFLFERLPGHAYIKAAMKLNFQRQQPSSFVVAVDANWESLYGFSVIGRKPGLNSDMYTQLLSAVRLGYRRGNIYQGLTRYLTERLPLDAILLNATHADNLSMQAAYQRSGRTHLADTVVMRRVFCNGHGPAI